MHNVVTLRKVIALAIGAVAISCCTAPGGPASQDKSTDGAGLELTSPSFAEGQTIPVKHTCDGGDVSPALKFGPVPGGTKTLALICDDPDAPGGTWVHWVLYNLPASVGELPEGLPASESLSNSALQGKNDFGKLGYGGPCPPGGAPHRYFFKLYAVDADLNLKAGATKQDLEAALRGHIIGQGKLVGKYSRTKA